MRNYASNLTRTISGRPVHRAHIPPDHAPVVVWSVFCGANTSQRVAEQCGITVRAAYDRLRNAYLTGWLRRSTSRNRDTYKGGRKELVYCVASLTFDNRK